jgi:hypothetical protein
VDIEMKKIKVIKKGVRAKREAAPRNDSRVKRRAAREMVNNVSGWIADLQDRKRNEARVAIEQLFGGPRTSES